MRGDQPGAALGMKEVAGRPGRRQRILEHLGIGDDTAVELRLGLYRPAHRLKLIGQAPALGVEPVMPDVLGALSAAHDTLRLGIAHEAQNGIEKRLAPRGHILSHRLIPSDIGGPSGGSHQ
jgi:hypothetical protein